MPRDDVLARVQRELQAIWPAAKRSQLLRWRLIVHPAQATALANVMLAGDWTSTGWPATMEGAVRSGYLAVEAILRSLGAIRPLLIADLPSGRLARRLMGD
jgi:uncharacterized protein with NAD-binding domain and iron-sulfur cluster